MKDPLLQHHKRDGFTLVEVLIALAVSGILLTSVFMAFKSQQDSYLAQDQVVEMQENIRAGVGIMVQELRMAGYDPGNTGNYGIETAGDTSVSFTAASNANEITFRFADEDGDGDMDIVRTEAGVSGVIAENFEALEFNYLDDEGDSPPNKVDDDGNLGPDVDKIANIEISVLARSQQPDNNFSDSSSTYTTASGDIWGPYEDEDNFRRRFQIITVNLRNKDK